MSSKDSKKRKRATDAKYDAKRKKITKESAIIRGFAGRYTAHGGTEKKFKDFTSGVAYVVPTLLTIPTVNFIGQLVSPITKNTGASDRVGISIVVKSLRVRGTFSSAETALANDVPRGPVFLLVVTDMQCNGAVAEISDIFTSASAHVAQPNLVYKNRFRVLKTICVEWPIPTAGEGTSGKWLQSVKFVDFFLNLDLPITYKTGAGGNIIDVTSNNLFLVMASPFCDNVTWSGSTRVRFEDA